MTDLWRLRLANASCARDCFNFSTEAVINALIPLRCRLLKLERIAHCSLSEKLPKPASFLRTLRSRMKRTTSTNNRTPIRKTRTPAANLERLCPKICAAESIHLGTYPKREFGTSLRTRVAIQAPQMIAIEEHARQMP